MAYGDNKQQNRSIADVLSDFTKFKHDNLTNERNHNQTILDNMVTIAKYQRDIRTQNMFMKRANATQRFLEAEKFARIEEDESKLPKWLEVMNQARREIGSTTDNESGFKQEGMLRELTMDDLLSMRKMDQMERKANGEIPTSGKNIADKIKDLNGANDKDTKPVNEVSNKTMYRPMFYPGYVAGSENTSVTTRDGIFSMPDKYKSFLDGLPINETPEQIQKRNELRAGLLFKQQQDSITSLFRPIKLRFEE